MMSEKEIDDFLLSEKLRQKIFKFKQKYHPQLIANLSKEAYDHYLIKDSVYSQIISLLDDKAKSLHEIKDFIDEKIKEKENKLKIADNTVDIKFIRLTIIEWKAIL